MARGGQGKAQGLFILGIPVPEHPTTSVCWRAWEQYGFKEGLTRLTFDQKEVLTGWSLELLSQMSQNGYGHVHERRMYRSFCC